MMKQTLSCHNMLSVAVLVVGLLYTTADLYTFDFGPPAGNNFPFTRIEKLDRQGRSLQSLAGDSNCFNEGLQFSCVADTTIQEEATDGANVTDGPFTEISVQVKCDFDSNIGFDFRRSQNCNCEATIERITSASMAELPDANPPPKVCPCLICAEGFGDAPVSIDCSFWENITMKAYAEANDLPLVNETTGKAIEYAIPDSLITSECSSLDCGLGCNGTCQLDCSESDSSCEFCSNNPENQRTAEPIVEGPVDNGLSDGDPFAPYSGAMVAIFRHVLVTLVLATVVATGTLMFS